MKKLRIVSVNSGVIRDVKMLLEQVYSKRKGFCFNERADTVKKVIQMGKKKH